MFAILPTLGWFQGIIPYMECFGQDVCFRKAHVLHAGSPFWTFNAPQYLNGAKFEIRVYELW